MTFLKTISSINPLLPKSDLQILLCLTPDDFTRQRPDPLGVKGVRELKSPQSSFAFNLVSPEEVRSEISCIPNSCPTQLLKCYSNVISGILADMLNISISTVVYPSKLKMAKIIPIFKQDDDIDANNYRPISLLSNFNRIFEKIVFKRMECFIEQKNLLTPISIWLSQGTFYSTCNPRYCECNSDKYGQPFILMWDFC